MVVAGMVEAAGSEGGVSGWEPPVDRGVNVRVIQQRTSNFPDRKCWRVTCRLMTTKNGAVPALARKIKQ